MLCFNPYLKVKYGMRTAIFIALLLASLQISAQTVLQLYNGKIPNSTGYERKEIRFDWGKNMDGYLNVSVPTLTMYAVPAGVSNGTAVIICPGGGYAAVGDKAEGRFIAEEYVRHGVTAFVLKYRLPSDSIMIDKTIGPLQDAQQAIKIVRERAKEWNIDPHKIGIMGFSAGGHLASTVATHFNNSYIQNDEKTSLKPDFLILIYPVISMTDEIGHIGSRDNLLGKKPSIDKIRYFSNELQVNEQTPPTWLTHTGDDTMVPVENSIRFYQALVAHKVPAEMHLYPSGNHAFVLKLPTSEWMVPLFDWMVRMNLLK
jgi:acetyl esterase/lipase